MEGENKGYYDTDEQVRKLIEFLGLPHDTPRDVLSQITYYTCIKTLSEAIGKIPIKVQQRLDRGVIKRADHPLWFALNKRPNKYQNAVAFWSHVEWNRSHRGNAFVLIYGSGKDTTLWELDPDKVDVYWDDARLLAKVPNIYYFYNAGDKRYQFDSSDILHFRTSNSDDGLMGIPIAVQLRRYIKDQLKADDMLGKMYDTGFTAKAVLQYTGNLNDENAKKFTLGIEKYTKGEMKSEGFENLIPIPIGAQITPLNVKLADSEFAEIKKYSALQIAAAFGIKPTQIGDYTKSSYSSEEAQQISFYVDTLLYPIEQYEQELTYKLFTRDEIDIGIEAKFDEKVIMRLDQEKQMNMLRSAVSNFLYTPNEARDVLDKPPIEGGDKLIGNGTNIPIDMVGQQYTKNKQAEGGESDE